jgi:hypothetical protein
LRPTVSITGGEPCGSPERLKQTIVTVFNNGVKKVNVNTSGLDLLHDPALAEFFKGRLPHLNISLHHWDRERNAKVFGNKKAIGIADIPTIRQMVGGGRYGDKPRVRLQFVLLKGQVDSLDRLERYLEHAGQVGIDDVAVRGLYSLPDGQGYARVSPVPLAPLLDKLAGAVRSGQRADRWVFVSQNIGEYYLSENWTYRSKRNKRIDVRFTYSDMQALRDNEQAERRAGDSIAREFVLFEDGSFAGGWNRDYWTLTRPEQPAADHSPVAGQ